MIIICPQCTKKFHLEDAGLPREPFKVRCSSCTLTWMVAPSSVEEVIVEKKIEEVIVEEFLLPEGEMDSPTATQPTNDFLKKLKEDNSEDNDSFSSPGRPPFTPRLDDISSPANNFAQRFKLDWVVLGLGLLIFLFVLILDNYYQDSFFSNLSRKDTYSIDRHQEEKLEQEASSNQPEYKAKPPRLRDATSALGGRAEDTEPLYLDRIGEK